MHDYMRSKIYLAKGTIAAFAVLAAMLMAISILAATSADDASLAYWQTPMKSFQSAGELIGDGKPDRARAELNYGLTNFPAPYSRMAGDYIKKLDSALGISDLKDPNRLSQLVELCTELRACDAALRLQPEQEKKKHNDQPASNDMESAWRLWETGDSKAALADYKRKLDEEPVPAWQNYWSEQVHLVELSRTNRNTASFTLELVRQHYLKGFELPPDYFSALQELTRALDNARKAPEKVVLHQFIIKTFDLMGDQAARNAWENKLLHDFQTNDGACASVYLDRGMRAYNQQDFAGALSLFRKVASDYPDTQSYGDAQYTLALILEQQQHYDEAIMEYARLFRSKVDDYAKPIDNTEDYKCYRFRAALGISGCYEEKGDYLHALEYAELARDHYKYLSWCKTCMEDMNRNLKARIAQLEQKIKTSDPIASDGTVR